MGGNSRLAGALRRYLPTDTLYLARAASDPACVAVGDYRSIRSEYFAGRETVINCTGLTRGAPTLLQAANVDAVRSIAQSARDAGVRRFVHVSSFSVFGGAEQIDADTRAAPTSAYGASKLAAESTLLDLANDDFVVAMLRLPAIVGGGGPDKLARLIRLWLRFRYLPVPKTPIHRSMISIDLASRVLKDVALGDDRGILLAADPELFTYERAAAVLANVAGRRVDLLRLPDFAVCALGRVSPSLCASLYGNSVLAAAPNRGATLPSDLYLTIAAMTKREIVE
jgi:nucleoside-diphosphate-sugar epimerase